MTHDIRDFGAVGDGLTDDTAAIQAAAAAAGNAGRVIIPPGTYLTTGISVLHYGQSWDIAGTIQLAPRALRPCLTIAADRVRVTGGIVDGNRAEQTADRSGIVVTSAGVTLRDVEVRAASGHGVALLGPKGNGLVSNCWIHDNGTPKNAIGGIYVNASPGNRIVGNRCDDNGTWSPNGYDYDGDGIKVQDGTGGAGGEQTIVTGNTCTHNARRGIKIQQSRAVVSDNICNDNGAGIGITNSGPGEASGAISGNILSGNGVGLQMDQCEDLVITGNLIQGSRAYGASIGYSVRRVLFASNVIQRSALDGMRVQGVVDVTFANNAIYDNGTFGKPCAGIYLYTDRNGIPCERVSLVGNVSENSGPERVQYFGFVVGDGCRALHMVGNRANNSLVPFEIHESVTGLVQFAATTPNAPA